MSDTCKVTCLLYYHSGPLALNNLLYKSINIKSCVPLLFEGQSIDRHGDRPRNVISYKLADWMTMNTISQNKHHDCRIKRNNFHREGEEKAHLIYF